MSRSSFFIKNKALFGSYPTQEYVNELENDGVKYFIDLTCPGEKRIKPYVTQYEYIRYPIHDRKIPNDVVSFSKLILKICKILKSFDDTDGKSLYIHCRGGHGRSGIVVACVLVEYFKISVGKALALTKKYHSNRKDMKERWRIIGSPQTYMQKNFVFKLFEPLFFDGTHSVLSMDSKHPVKIEIIGSYSNTKEAYAAGKNMFSVDNNWENTKFSVMYTILYHKFKQNNDACCMLLSTGLRKLMYNVKKEVCWGTDGIVGKNMLGKLLIKIREKLFIDINND
jgi:predicted NAD-dependent protein-ADP-ribosyltransferase YbiA (DUF1768 family)/protein-tyrosine phosphatase